MMARRQGKTMWNRVLTIILAIAILGVIGTLGYVLVLPRVGENFTEFYIFGPEGEAENYPEELVVGEEARVIVGIINREHEPATYRVEVLIGGVKSNEVGPVTLENDMKWEWELSFMPGMAGDNQEVEFLLYKNDGEIEPYLKPLRLWINVKE